MGMFRGFLLFCLIYLSPYLLGVDLGGRMAPVVLALMDRVAGAPPFQWALGLTLFTHGVLLALCYPVYRALYARIMVLTSARPWVVSWGAAVLLTVLLYAWNQWLFHETRHQLFPEGVLLPVLGAVTAGVVALLAPALGSVRVAPARQKTLLATVAVMGAVSLVAMGFNRDVGASAGRAQRNVIIIGIDSLSQRVLQAHPDAMPQFQRLYRQAVVHTNAWTPMARTCPAWLSILSGRPPAEHGAVFNLRAADRIDRSGLMSTVMQQDGYATVFALDERRFCNIDETFGFDRVVGPAHGALDFLIQKVNDAPLVNALLQAPWSAYFLPHSRLNVAAHASYPAQDFVRAVQGAVAAERKPVFLVTHLESGHYPYKARDARSDFTAANPFLTRHVNALSVVDAQIATLMAGLREAGRLDDALVVFVSDHGESFGDERPIPQVDGSVSVLPVYGHGTSLMAPEQNHVVLGYLEYRQGRVVNRPQQIDHMVSLMDVKPLVQGYARDGGVAPLPARACVTMETGIRVSALADYTRMDEQQAVASTAGYYTVDGDARMHLREDRMPELIAMKDVASRCGDTITSQLAGHSTLVSFQDGPNGLTQVQLDPLGAAQVQAYRQRLALQSARVAD